MSNMRVLDSGPTELAQQLLFLLSQGVLPSIVSLWRLHRLVAGKGVRPRDGLTHRLPPHCISMIHDLEDGRPPPGLVIRDTPLVGFLSQVNGHGQSLLELLPSLWLLGLSIASDPLFLFLGPVP